MSATRTVAKEPARWWTLNGMVNAIGGRAEKEWTRTAGLPSSVRPLKAVLRARTSIGCWLGRKTRAKMLPRPTNAVPQRSTASCVVAPTRRELGQIGRPCVSSAPRHASSSRIQLTRGRGARSLVITRPARWTATGAVRFRGSSRGLTPPFSETMTLPSWVRSAVAVPPRTADATRAVAIHANRARNMAQPSLARKFTVRPISASPRWNLNRYADQAPTPGAHALRMVRECPKRCKSSAYRRRRWPRVDGAGFAPAQWERRVVPRFPRAFLPPHAARTLIDSERAFPFWLV